MLSPGLASLESQRHTWWGWRPDGFNQTQWTCLDPHMEALYWKLYWMERDLAELCECGFETAKFPT